MTRCLLTLWFALATVMGPALCCCMRSAAASTASAKESSALHSSSCCQKHQGASGGGRRAPSTPDCPFHSDPDQCLVANPPTATIDPRDSQNSLIDDFASGLILMLTPSATMAPPLPLRDSPSTTPFVDTEQLLYV